MFANDWNTHTSASNEALNKIVFWPNLEVQKVRLKRDQSYKMSIERRGKLCRRASMLRRLHNCTPWGSTLANLSTEGVYNDVGSSNRPFARSFILTHLQARWKKTLARQNGGRRRWQNLSVRLYVRAFVLKVCMEAPCAAGAASINHCLSPAFQIINLSSRCKIFLAVADKGEGCVCHGAYLAVRPRVVNYGRTRSLSITQLDSGPSAPEKFYLLNRA